MGRASTAKKVSRAAATGGGGTKRGSTPWGWYGGLAAVVVVLGALLASAVLGRRNPEPPGPTDHWHMAIGLYACGAGDGSGGYLPDLAQPSDLIGIHTHSDGIVHVEPQSSADTGGNATLGRWDEGQPDLELDADSITVGERTWSNGDACPGGQPGRVRVIQDGQEVDTEPGDVRIRPDGQVTVAFAPEGSPIPPIPDASAKIAAANGGQTEPSAENPDGGPPGPNPQAGAPAPAAATTPTSPPATDE